MSDKEQTTIGNFDFTKIAADAFLAEEYKKTANLILHDLEGLTVSEAIYLLNYLKELVLCVIIPKS